MKNIVVLLSLVLVACGSATNLSTTTGLRLDSAGDFESSASANLSNLILQSLTTGACDDLDTPITSDNPILADDLDCDEDGGIVKHITPTQYSIAFKRVTLLGVGVDHIDFVSDTGTLALSEVIDFTTTDSSTTLATLDPEDLAAGTYSGIEAEIYYFQLSFPVGGTTRNVRIYMSDDDFPVEGSLGHHQGDITFISDAGVELGWIDSTWSDTLATSRSDDQNGAGGTDAETGHDRGFFGDSTLWDAPSRALGSTQDVFIALFPFAESLVIPDISTIDGLTTITINFSVADAFYYEDFAPQGTGFSPAAGGEATSDSAEWAPLIPTASVTVTSS